MRLGTRLGIGVLSAVALVACSGASGGGPNGGPHDGGPDGTTDDTGKIQAAVDAARPTGGIVFFPPGTYSTRRVTLHSRIHLRGSGVDATVLKLRPGANSAILESEGFAPAAELLAQADQFEGWSVYCLKALTK